MRLLLSVATVLFLPALLAIALLLGSDGSERSQAAPLRGAIFTTTPDGGIVNENVHYERKIEVYLDGGPGPNAPQTAAGLPDGDYVFQVTDPPGKVLLSEDASKCRVFRVSNGVIVALRDKNTGFVDHTVNDPCHINDSPDGAAGASGQHDTNVDSDHGPPAIVVQLMPFFDTPNPGGVYKAWVIPIARYLSNGGNLGPTPVEQCERNGRPANNCNGNAVQIGFQRDPGFGPPRDEVKTDNFKVREVPRPMLKVRKFHDINANGRRDAGEPEIGVDQCVASTNGGAIIACPGGWPIDITDPNAVTNGYFTPVEINTEPFGTWQVCEAFLPGWTQSAAYRDDPNQTSNLNTQCVNVEVVGTFGETHEVVFGNFRPGAIRGTKFIDMNANGQQDAGEGCPASPPNNAGCQGITIHLFGTDGMGQAVHLHTPTDANGDFAFTNIKPGSYTVCEEVPAEFLQSFPPAGANCSGHSASAGGVVRNIGYSVTLTSGQVVEDRDFGNFSLAEVHGLKFFDRNGNRLQDSGEEGIQGITIHLFGTNGMAQAVHQHALTAADGTYSFLNLVPGSYTVCEEVPAGSGLSQSFPAAGANCTSHPANAGGIVQAVGHAVTLTSDQVCEDKDFGNFGPCDGLTPGFWSNWRNHFTSQQFKVLLQGTVAHVPSDQPVTNDDIARADEFLNSIGCDNDDALHCMRRFLLANQLTLNLTLHPELPNPDTAGLVRLCSIPGIGTLGQAIDDALAILANPGAFSRDQILAVKNRLAAFAELNG